MKLNNFMKIVKIPSSLGGLTKKGSMKAPDLIVEEIKNFFLNEDGSSAQFDIENVDVDVNDIEETNRRIASKEGDIFIGGDHSITYPCFSNFAKKFKNPGLIVFDSHPDCVNDFKPPSHEDYVKVLVKEGTLKKSQMIEDMHPDVARVAWRFNRWHHYVNYKPFEKNKLIKRKNLAIDKINNYGLILKEVKELA